MTSSQQAFYMCVMCFNASEEPGECHVRPLLKVECGPPGDESTLPVTTPDGKLVTRAPRWWVEQVCKQLFEERRR